MNLKVPHQLMGIKRLAIDKFKRDEEVGLVYYIIHRFRIIFKRAPPSCLSFSFFSFSFFFFLPFPPYYFHCFFSILLLPNDVM